MSGAEIFGDLLGLTEAAEGTAAAPWLTGYYGLGTLIRAGTEAGLSGREILASYRDAGGTVADHSYWELRNAVLGASAPPFGRDYLSLVQGRDVTEYPGGREGLHQINFRVFVRNEDASGLPRYSITNYSVTQRDFDIDKAVAKMQYVMEGQDTPENTYSQWMGFEISSVRRYTG